MTISDPAANHRKLDNLHHNYDLIRIYSYYRALLASLLLLLHASAFAPNILGNQHPDVFLYTSVAYAIANILILLALLWRKSEPSTLKFFSSVVLDIGAIVILTYASGGLESGLGYLLIVSVAAGSIVLPGQIPLLLAAIATLLVLGESISQGDAQAEKAVFSAGTLGIILFLTATGIQYLSQRLRASNREAERQAQQAAHLQHLAQQIIQRMRTGIIVLDPDNKILLINQSARKLLDLPKQVEKHLDIYAGLKELMEQLQIWRAYAHTRTPTFKLSPTGPEIQLSFANLDPDANSDTLIFVEDNRQLTQQAQQLKLASLGRLTASIAHEIRNPLGAISHAGQLLAESNTISSDDKRMVDIIGKHSGRVNDIIENIMQLSRRQASRAEPLNLSEWLEKFVEDYIASHPENYQLELLISEQPTFSNFDPSQLNQIMTNLCDNGIRYSFENTGDYRLNICLAVDSFSELPYLDVVDYGKGIPEQDIPNVFEPFFTTATNGSGLGLYLSRELCEANQASLHHMKTKDNHTCFRITFAHPQRVF